MAAAPSGAMMANGSPSSKGKRKNGAPTARNIWPSSRATAPPRRRWLKAALDLDRGVSAPSWGDNDGNRFSVYVADDMSRLPGAGFRSAAVRRCRVVKNQWCSTAASIAGGCAVVISGGDTRHNEIYATEGGLRSAQLTHANDEIVGELDLGKTEEVTFQVEGRQRSSRPFDLSGRIPDRERRFRCCCAFTADRKVRTPMCSASKPSFSPPMATLFCA